METIAQKIAKAKDFVIRGSEDYAILSMIEVLEILAQVAQPAAELPFGTPAATIQFLRETLQHSQQIRREQSRIIKSLKEMIAERDKATQETETLRELVRWFVDRELYDEGAPVAEQIISAVGASWLEGGE